MGFLLFWAVFFLRICAELCDFASNLHKFSFWLIGTHLLYDSKRWILCLLAECEEVAQGRTKKAIKTQQTVNNLHRCSDANVLTDLVSCVIKWRDEQSKLRYKDRSVTSEFQRERGGGGRLRSARPLQIHLETSLLSSKLPPRLFRPL